ncbi:PREDICTED: uncharacterized protein LOC104784253 [Camelina sativa]|uniref:Uncharacterized protein LOC104784253 n=1 Tax=Camelina sativa TaxID=90675 RepID=A0ABM0YXU0_CAMSA|nr:PREDICTED: uncharacterized protein LOC104784253 [Camelina sativa]
MAENSDSSSALCFSHCVTLKLSSTNYLLWKIQFETWLNNQRLLDHVTGSTPCPPATRSVKKGETVSKAPNPDFLAWVNNDQKIMGWLIGSPTEEALSVYGLHTSGEVWFSLAKKYNHISASRKSDLQRRLHSTEKEGKTLAEYLNTIKQICDQLHSIEYSVPENEKFFGLGQEYESIATMIESQMDTFPMSYDDVVIKLTNFDDKIQKYVGSSVSPHLAFTTGRDFSNRGRPVSWSLWWLPWSWQLFNQGQSFHQQISNGQFPDSGPRPTYQICNKYGHSAYRCYKRFDHSYQGEELPNALAAMHITGPPGHEWTVDSGATSHITNSTAQLQTVQPYSGEDSVIVGNGDFLPIAHIGSSVLPSTQGNIPLQDILVCPQITKSLLSVSKHTSDYPCAIEFDYDGVIIKDKWTKQLLTKGPHRRDLYLLENPQFMACYSSRQQATSDEV